MLRRGHSIGQLSRLESTWCAAITLYTTL